MYLKNSQPIISVTYLFFSRVVCNFPIISTCTYYFKYAFHFLLFFAYTFVQIIISTTTNDRNRNILLWVTEAHGLFLNNLHTVCSIIPRKDILLLLPSWCAKKIVKKNAFLFFFNYVGADVGEVTGIRGTTFRYPSYVQDIMGEIFSLGFGPFRFFFFVFEFDWFLTRRCDQRFCRYLSAKWTDCQNEGRPCNIHEFEIIKVHCQMYMFLVIQVASDL